jgi:hypothetical protein
LGKTALANERPFFENNPTGKTKLAAKFIFQKCKSLILIILNKIMAFLRDVNFLKNFWQDYEKNAFCPTF